MDPINNTPPQAPINPNTSAVEPRNKGLFAGLIILIVLLALGAIIVYAYSGARDMDSDYADDHNKTMNEDGTYQNANGGANDTVPSGTSNDDSEEIGNIETEVNSLNSAELE